MEHDNRLTTGISCEGLPTQVNCRLERSMGEGLSEPDLGRTEACDSLLPRTGLPFREYRDYVPSKDMPSTQVQRIHCGYS